MDDSHDACRHSVRKALLESPLTACELRRGVAIRVLACYKCDNESNQWTDPCLVDVVVLSRGTGVTGPLRLLSLPVGRRSRPSLMRLDGWDQELDDVSWHVDEWELRMPMDSRGLVLKTRRAHGVVDASRVRHLVWKYCSEIANASWDEGYSEWLSRKSEELSSREVPPSGPLMSLVMPIYRTPPIFLREAIQSVLVQTYRRWELVLVNASPDDEGVRGVLSDLSVRSDERVRVVELGENHGISGNTNVGIEHSRGDYVCFFDHDDVLEPFALAELVRAIQEADAPVGLAYCDEDNLDEQGRPCLPLLKPDLNLDLLLSGNYAVHLLTVSRQVLEATARSTEDVNGAQDYDLTLKAVHAGARVIHVPHVLYHWRIHAASVASGSSSKPYAMEAGRRSIDAYLAARSLDARVRMADVDFSYEVDFALPRPAPALLCLARGPLCARTRQALDGYAKRHGAAVDVTELPAEVSAMGWSATLATMGGGEGHLLLAIDGCVALGLDDLVRLVGYFSRDEVFAVSPRVIRPDGLLDFAGMLVRPDGSLCRLNHLLPENDKGYVARARHAYDSAVLNAECLVVRLDELAPMLADGYSRLEYLLADACLGARGKGLLSVFCPFATGRLEVSRSLCAGPALVHVSDQKRLRSRHGAMLAGGDPSHNPNFDPWSEYYKLRHLGG